MCRLLRSIYLRQSGRLWNQKVVAFLKGLGFHPLNADASILIHHGKDKDDITMMSLYVDNFVIVAKRQSSMEWIKTHPKVEYNVKDLGEVKTIIGWQVTRDLVAGTLKIDQSAFVRDLLEEEDIVDCSSVSIPMKAGSVIEMNDVDDYEETDLKAYQRLIGNLMYLSCSTRSDIAFAVGQLSRRNADPRVGHLKAAKRVVRYLKGTMHLGIIYGTSSSTDSSQPYGFVGYADSNYAGDPEVRKSVIEHCFFINRAVASWCSKKQRTVSTSTTETDYITLGHAARESVWIRQFLNELEVADPIDACILHGDNETSIILTKNAESQARTKHIDVQHH